jgi:hypothetical protein
MRTRIVAATLLFFFAASLARAQPGTAEGVDAFVRGDYQRAADVLKPIAEQSPDTDHVAEFFMAALYDSGRGVTADPMRACAFYLRASDDRGPFGMQAMALVNSRRGLLGREAFEECTWRARVGFDHRFEPVTFALGPGHWIAWDLKGATTTCDGKEKWVPLPFARNRAVILPLRYTELAVGPTRSTRRHFIEILRWLPGAERQTWVLMWALMEVVRNDVIGVVSEQLATISAPEPPAAGSFDVREMVRLGVNADGDAEWSLVGGPHPRTAVIETDANREEQEEVRRQTHARDAADARVDWKRAVDLHRPPAFTYADADGCGHVFVYGWSDDRAEAIAVRADKDLLQLSTMTQTFDLAVQNSSLELVLHVYERPVQHWPFCTDVVFPAAPEETWRVTRGTVTVELSPPGVSARAPFLYRATIRIVGAEFVNGSGVRVKQRQPITLTAMVGSVAGG